MMGWQRGVAAAAGAGIAASGAEALTLRRRVRNITIPTLPTALEGLTILHVSDVHAGYGPGLALLRRSALWAAELEPDIIAVTGDLVARRRAGPAFGRQRPGRRFAAAAGQPGRAAVERLSRRRAAVLACCGTARHRRRPGLGFH